MATKPLKSIKWPNLPDRYWVVQADGSYQQMTVGNAEQLVSTVGIEDKVPYNFRTAGGANDIGDREVDKVIGVSYPWNQHISTVDYTNDNTDTKPALSLRVRLGDSPYTNLFQATVSATGIYSRVEKCTFTGRFQVMHSGSANDLIIYTSGAANVLFENHVYLFSGNFPAVNPTTVGGLKANNLMLFDLTQMLGSTIADYINTLETATAGAGVAFFRSLFPAPYYAYNAGELMHVQTSAHKMTGLNLLKTTATSKTESGVTYTVNSDGTITVSGTANAYTSLNIGQAYVLGLNRQITISGLASVTNIVWSGVDLADENGNVVHTITSGGSTDNFTVDLRQYPTAAYCRMTVKRNGNVATSGVIKPQIQIGASATDFEPYTERTYPLDGDLVLRGKPKLDANNSLYYDGDEYASDGTVNRKRKVIDLGEQDWTYNSTYQFFITSLEDAKSPANADALPDLVCTKYEEKTPRFVIDTSYGNGIALAISGYGGEGKLVVRDTAYTDAATFTSAMSGVMLDYPLATPTTESADPYANPQWVDDFGTEEYIDTRDVPIPVGHDTFYRANLRDKLQHLPEPAESNGTYAIQQTDGQMALVPMPAVLPALPTEDGTYSLKITVSGSTKTLSWEADE